MMDYTGVISGRSTPEWFPNREEANEFARRQHATGLTVVVVDDTFNPIAIYKTGE
jgi:hypothetical protein